MRRTKPLPAPPILEPAPLRLWDAMTELWQLLGATEIALVMVRPNEFGNLGGRWDVRAVINDETRVIVVAEPDEKAAVLSALRKVRVATTFPLAGADVGEPA